MSKQIDAGYFVRPDSGSGPGILVLHAWWGLNDTIRSFCNRLAAAGYVTLAADLYHGQVAQTIPEAEALGGALDERYQEARREIRLAAELLQGETADPSRPIAVIGFSLGAFYALDLAESAPELVQGVVLFYGSGGGDWSGASAAILGHFAENDPYEPSEQVTELEESLREAGLSTTFYRYPGVGHWFFEPDRLDAYDEAAAQLAWERTLAFLAQEMNG